MSLVAFLPLLLSLGIYLVPVWLLHRQDRSRAQDNFVSSRPASPATIRNSSIAHALRLAAFGPFFVLGARGDLWPVMVGAAGLGAGTTLLYLLRRPLLAFLAEALGNDRSITLHAFIARQHGDDRRVRIFSAGLTLFALTVLIAGEAFALAGFLKLIIGNEIAARGVTLLILGLAALYAFPAGHSGTMHANQLQLAVIFFGLFGTAALLLYLHVSTLTPLPPHGHFAVLFVGGYGVALMIYRRSRYLDTGPVAPDARSAKWLSLLGKILNPLISVLVVLAVVLALMEGFAAGFPAAVGAGVAALKADTSLPVTGLLTLALLPLFYPLTDVTNWQRLAAAEKNRKGFKGDAALRSFFRLYAREGALLWLFIACLGALAVAATAIPPNANVMQAFVQELKAGDNDLGSTVLAVLLVTVFAIALAAMSAAFSAGLCTIGYDIMPAGDQIGSDRSIGGRVFFLAVIVALGLADVAVRIDFTSSGFLALVFALGAPPLGFAPLILGPIIAGRGISAGWALLILGAGAASSVATVAAFAVSGNENWLWAAAPLCLLCGFVLLGLSLVTTDR